MLMDLRFGLRMALSCGVLIGLGACPTDPSDSDVDVGSDVDSDSDVDSGTEGPTASASYTDTLGDSPDFSISNSTLSATADVENGLIALFAVFRTAPPVQPHIESATNGQCRIVRHTPSSCSPECSPDAVCVDSTCLTHPTPQPRGTINVTWADGSADVEPTSDSVYAMFGNTQTHGDITVAFDDTTLTGPSITPVAPIGNWTRALMGRDDDDAILEWSNPIQGARIRLNMTDCVGHNNGLTEHELECEGPDTGLLTIPGEFLDLLDDGDWSEASCGFHQVQRYVAAAPPGDDSIRFISSASTQLPYWGDEP